MLRPNLQEFFARVGKLYEIVIFTASLKKYANMIIDIIDKEKVCTYRLFREQCSYINNIYVKELKRLNRNMKNIVILDNNPNAFCLDCDNEIPIKSFFDDKNDKELIQMAYVLEKLAKVNDVRPYIKEIVDMNQINYDRAFELFKQKDDVTPTEGTPIKGANGLKGQLKIVRVEKIASNGTAKTETNHTITNTKQTKNKSNNTKSNSLNINNKLNSSSGKSFRSSAQRSVSKEDNNTPNKQSPFKINNHLNNNSKEQKVKLIPPNGNKMNINTNFPQPQMQKKKTKSSMINDNSNRIFSKDKRNNTASRFNLPQAEISKRPKSVIPLKVNELKSHNTKSNNINIKATKPKVQTTSKEKKTLQDRNKAKPLVTSTTTSSNNTNTRVHNQYKKPASFINARELSNKKEGKENEKKKLKRTINTSVGSSTNSIPKTYSRHSSSKARPPKKQVPIPAKSERQKNYEKTTSPPSINNPSNSATNFSSRSKSSSKSNLKTINGKVPKVSKSSELKIVKVVPNVFHSIAKNIFSKTDSGSNSFKSFRNVNKK